MNLLHGLNDDMRPLFEERSTFPVALLAALILEIVALLLAVSIARHHGPVAPHPQVTRIQMLAPPKPKPKPLPPPPKPVQPPPPLPKPPLPVAPPKPPPPRPIPKPHPKPVVRHHRIVHRPKPKPKPVQQHVAAPSPPRPAPIPAAVRENALEAYAGAVHQTVQADLKVPAMVEMMHLSGVTRIALRIAPDGHLLGARVIHSSGVPPIDRAALAAVRATRFPRFSRKMPDHPITVDISIRLRSN